MKNSIRLSIENPCHEKWESFSMQSNGGFCSTCEKTVVDFTKLSDEAILAFFANKPARTCGRFRDDQLRSYAFNDFATVSPGRSLLRAGFLSLIFMLSIGQSYAQTEVARTTSELASAKTQGTDDRRITSQYFSGVVKDEDGNAMAAVNIMLKGTTTGTATDAEGRFSFPVQLKAGDVLLFSFIGYETVEYTISSQTDTTIEMKMEYQITLGAVAVEGCYQQKETLWSKIKNLF